MNLVFKNGICVHICSKFAVKSEASHKNIVKVDFLMLVRVSYRIFGLGGGNLLVHQ